jgi:hypothetical protein
MKLVTDAVREQMEDDWLHGGSALPLVSLLADRGEIDAAAAIARVALGRDGCLDAKKIEAIVERLSEPPADWLDQLDDFAASPTLEKWRAMMRFVPPDLMYQRQRSTMRRLMQMNIDVDILFLCASEYGLTPDAIDLVEEHGVSVKTIVERSSRAGAARATYLGLAAEAAFLRGDLVGTIRLLRSSISCESEWCVADPHIYFIRVRATQDELDALDKAGIRDV